MRNSLAVLLIVVAATASAQELGTLFLTPKERQALDSLRKGEPAEAANQPQKEGSVIPKPVVTGYVKRSDGKSTVFIDKQPYPVTSGRTQSLLEPKIVENYEPLPRPALAEPAPAGGSAKDAEKPGPAKDAAPTPPKNPKGD